MRLRLRERQVATVLRAAARPADVSVASYREKALSPRRQGRGALGGA